MAEIALAFWWHQHQPYYPDDVGGDNPMPWVRLHGVKDYYGMALHLKEYPAVRCTINLVPSLLAQIEAYTDRDATDRFLQVSRLPADGLSEADALFLLDHFFMANHDTMIRPFPRYAELLQQRDPAGSSATQALRRFRERDLRDLQVWFNLAWVHPIALEQEEDLRGLVEKGRHFSEADKLRLLDKHIEIMRRIVPLHRELAEAGQVELTTTPYYHPILPLLLDKKFALEAMPDVRLPFFTGGYPEDAELHVRRAVETHERVFGSKPRGMWPAEGSVCQAMLPLLAKHGIRFIGTDEEVLGRSTHGAVYRDNRGFVRSPERLYQPYRVKEADAELGIVFRDHALSDLIGFHYQRDDPATAAEDFFRHLQAIAQAIPGDGTALVPVILDGENCWEHYPGGGVQFLRELYARCSATPGVRTVRLGDFLEEHRPKEALPRLFAGSWIAHNFAIWIGHHEDNTAWDALHQTRQYLSKRGREGSFAAETIARAWEEIYIAEGSDWFWWFGDDHSSAQDALFDYLFRKHLQNVYLLLGDQPPAGLSRPISQSALRIPITLPKAFLKVKIDGRQTFFEWVGSGRYTVPDEGGSMSMSRRGPIRDVFFGFDVENLYLRLDFDRPASAVLPEFDALRVRFVEPGDAELHVERPARAGMAAALRVGRGEWSGPAVRVAIDQIVEIAVPFEYLNVPVDGPIQFYVELLQGKQSRDRAPLNGIITTKRPSPHFEKIMWDA